MNKKRGNKLSKKKRKKRKATELTDSQKKKLKIKKYIKACHKKNDSLDCKYNCGQKANHGRINGIPLGDSIGNSPKLANNILKAHYEEIKEQVGHPLSLPDDGDGKFTAQAHHLICSQAMGNMEWAKLCVHFGYDINHENNGVFLPSSLEVACELAIPLHVGNHSDTLTHVQGLNYVEAVKAKISSILDKAYNKDYCNGNADVIKELDEKSKEIWDLIKYFWWTLTFDGFHYHKSSPIGCFKSKTIDKKKKNLRTKGLTPRIRVKAEDVRDLSATGCPRKSHSFKKTIKKGTYFLER